MKEATEIEKRQAAKDLAERMGKISNVELTKILMKEHADDEHVQEMLRRFDECLDCMLYPHVYYKKDVYAFVDGKKTTLKTVNL